MTPRQATVRVCAAILATTLAAGCATTPDEPSEPVVRVVERAVPTPVPCPGLQSLGPRPTYPDTDEQLRATRNLAEQVRALLNGRDMRAQRESEYEAAARACDF